MESRKFSDLPPFRFCAIVGPTLDEEFFDAFAAHFGKEIEWKISPRISNGVMIFKDARKVKGFGSYETIRGYRPDLILIDQYADPDLIFQVLHSAVSANCSPDHIFYFRGDELYQ